MRWTIILLASALAVVASTTSFRSVQLAWDASPSAGITNYRVYYGVASRTYTNHVNAGTNLTVGVSNLQAGVTFWFSATALAHGMESDYSEELSYTVPDGRPTVPQKVKVRDE